ncbi:hypothetical protein K0M31_016883 [Melipona bicolor]|uniref:Uncharacterized protein n=1 Tax=Melipona bicolor TaxID=60889 RepID=A0AA40FER3_9HYME|nr:hypothetical protein K0M31_016883 [Melipona bicolor]
MPDTSISVRPFVDDGDSSLATRNPISSADNLLPRTTYFEFIAFSWLGGSLLTSEKRENKTEMRRDETRRSTIKCSSSYLLRVMIRSTLELQTVTDCKPPLSASKFSIWRPQKTVKIPMRMHDELNLKAILEDDYLAEGDNFKLNDGYLMQCRSSAA